VLFEDLDRVGAGSSTRHLEFADSSFMTGSELFTGGGPAQIG